MRKKAKHLKNVPFSENVERVRLIREKAMKQSQRSWSHPVFFIAAGAVLIVVVIAVLTGRSEAAPREIIIVEPLYLEEKAIVTEADRKETEPFLETMKNEVQEEYVGELKVAAYCGCQDCNGKFGAGVTWSGQLPAQGVTVAADLTTFRIGDMLRIGQNMYRVEDKVPSGSSEVLCLYFDDHADAFAFGRQTLPVFKVKSGEEQSEGGLGYFQITGYCSCEKCCGKKEEKLTKTGTIPKAGHTVAADPEVLPMGSRVKIDGITYTVEDTGNLVKGNVIDIYFDTHEEAMKYGRKEKRVYLVQ